jgi:AraC-like DNA-binding protein
LFTVQKGLISRNDIQQLSNTEAYIRSHYAGKTDIDTLSRIACMSATKFKRCFRQLYGESVHEYIVKIRIAEAQKLLADRSLRISEAAYAVGYSKPGAFTDAFKKHTGMLPRAYRKNALFYPQ